MLELNSKFLNNPNFIEKTLWKDGLPKLNQNIQKPDLSLLKSFARENAYRIIGNKVEVGQGCIFVGNPTQELVSFGFDTCAPFIMLSKKDGKQVLGHIDAESTPQEIAKKIQAHFAPKEIESASFYYYRGADMLAPGQNLGQLAINKIEEALNLLGVKGHCPGRLSTFDKVIVDSEGIKIERFNKIEKRINL